MSSALALLIKGSAFVLVLVVPLTLLLVRRNVSWLWSRETWRVFAIVAVLALPWYFFSRAWLAHEILPSPSHHFGAAIPYSIKHNGVIFICGGTEMSKDVANVIFKALVMHTNVPYKAFLEIGEGTPIR